MRLALLLCCSMLFTHLIFAQEYFNPYNDVKPKITGKLIGYDPIEDAELTLLFSLVSPTQALNGKKTITPRKDGSFEVILDHPFRYQQIWFKIGDYYYAQLIADKELTITADLAQLKKGSAQYDNKNVQFDGSDGEMNHFINQYTTYMVANRKKGNPEQTIMMDRSLAEEEKVRQLRLEFQDKEKLDNNFLEENPSPYAWILENERLSEFYGDVCVIHWGKEMPADLYAEVLEHEPKLVSNSGMMGYYGYLSSYLYLHNSRELLTTYQKEILPSIEVPEEKERLQAFIQMSEEKEQGLEVDKTLYGKESGYFYKQYKQTIKMASIKEFVKKTEKLPSMKADLVRLRGGSRDVWEQEQYITCFITPTSDMF